MEISIRQAQAEDAALLASLNAAVQDIHAAEFPSFFKPADAQDPALIVIFAAHLAEANTRAFIAEVEGVAVGYILLILRQNAENPYAFANSRLHVDQMSVNAEFRGKGVGHALMERTKTLGQELGADYITLNVWEFNKTAIEFYQREGFEITSFNMWQKVTSNE